MIKLKTAFLATLLIGGGICLPSTNNSFNQSNLNQKIKKLEGFNEEDYISDNYAYSIYKYSDKYIIDEVSFDAQNKTLKYTCEYDFNEMNSERYQQIYEPILGVDSTNYSLYYYSNESPYYLGTDFMDIKFSLSSEENITYKIEFKYWDVDSIVDLLSAPYFATIGYKISWRINNIDTDMFLLSPQCTTLLENGVYMGLGKATYEESFDETDNWASSYYYEEGYKEGNKDGVTSGYEKGYKDGYISGNQDGYKSGYQEATENSNDNATSEEESTTWWDNFCNFWVNLWNNIVDAFKKLGEWMGVNK